MKYLVNNCTDAQWNMAHDEFLLEQMPGMVFCLWQNGPSVIVGQNQSVYAEVNLPYLQEHGIMLARRVTGGGAVYHDLGNLNYSIAGPMEQMEDALDLVPAALRRMGASVERSGRNDLMLNGRKCSGYAKRMSRDRVMIHGTLMWDVKLEELTQALAVPGSKLEAAGIASVRSRVTNLKDALPQFRDIGSFKAALQQELAQGDPEISITPDQLASINRMADEKFRSWDWIYGRSPATGFKASRKFGCGTVEAGWTVEHGCMARLSFTGDFMGNLPSDTLCAGLEGCRFEKPAVLDALKKSPEPVCSYFDGLVAEDLLSLFF